MTKKVSAVEAKAKLSSHPRGVLALVGLWKDVSEKEIDAFLADIYKAREKDIHHTAGFSKKQ